jgi:hypothetical protein
MAAVRVVFPWSTWPIVPMLRCGLSRMYACLVMTGLLLVPPVALADPRALRAPRDAPPFPAGSRKRTGKGQRRVPSWASTPDDGRAEESGAEESGAEAAVSAARQGAQMAETANRNTSASVRHRPPARKGFSRHRPCESAINAIDACGNRGDEVGASDAI